MRRILIALMAFVFVSASAVAQRLPAGVGDSEVRLYAQLLAMTDTRSFDTVLIDRALQNSWQPLRAAAALAVGQVGAEHGLQGATRLRQLLSDGDVNVAANAAYALGLLRDSASVGALSTAIAGAPAAVAREAAWALGEIGAPSRNAITAALQRHADNGTVIQLLLAAAKLRPVPVAAIEPYLKERDLSVVWAAAYAIARNRSPAGVRDLIALERSESVRARVPHVDRSAAASGPYSDLRTGPALVRAEIARGLAHSAAGDSLGSVAFEVLARLVRDDDPHVRINAVRSLATYGARSKSAVANATKDADPNVRIAAAQSLGTVLTRESTDFALLWGADTSIVYRSSLLASAARAGLRPQQLIDWRSSTDWRLRAAVANAAGDSTDRTFALARNASLLTDADPRVREAAYGAIVPPASMALEDSVHQILIHGLRDPDFYVRATILSVLADRPSAEDLGAVMASYSLAARDSANDARLAALQYIGALWKKDSAGVNAGYASSLAKLPTPADPLERAAVRSIPLFAKWATVSPTPRPLDWYASIVREVALPRYRGKRMTATIRTVRGPIRLELFGSDAPLTVYNFLSLARSGYYRNTRFHRVVPNFVAQDGDPRDDGNGGPGYSIRDEMNRRRYERGAVGMALSGPDTGGSQYFITHSPQPHLDGHYTVFGRVISGYDVLDKIVQGDLITTIDPK